MRASQVISVAFEWGGVPLWPLSRAVPALRCSDASAPSLPALPPLRCVANGAGYAVTLALYWPLAAVMPRYPQIVWNLPTVAPPRFRCCLAEIFPSVFFAPVEIPSAGDGSCDALCLAVIDPDSLARPDSNLSRKIFLVAWWQVKRDVPMLAVMIVAPARVFAHPYARPSDAAIGDPFS